MNTNLNAFEDEPPSTTTHDTPFAKKYARSVVGQTARTQPLFRGDKYAKGPLFVTSGRCASKILRHKNFGGTALTSTPGVMVSGPVIRFELKDGRIVRKYFYGHKTKKDVELPADFPIPGWGAYGG